MKPPKLGINIDHVATLRQARLTSYPDPLEAARIAEKAGADQITVHLREDRRHIQDADLKNLKNIVSKDLNLELAASAEIVAIAEKVRPNVCTFVPERRNELTTEGGLDVVKYFNKLNSYVRQLKANSINVSMFIDPEVEQVLASREILADAIELHTGRYCECLKAAEVSRLKGAAAKAKEIGLYVAAGHGLNYDNTALIVKEVPEIVEYNIGHSVIARAVFVGLERAVVEMRLIVKGV